MLPRTDTVAVSLAVAVAATACTSTSFDTSRTIPAIPSGPQAVRSNAQSTPFRPTRVFAVQPPVTIRHQHPPTPANIESDELEISWGMTTRHDDNADDFDAFADVAN